jgi:hypothetical protein
MQKFGLIAKSKRWLHSWLKRQQAQREIRNLGIEEVAFIAHDLGLSMGELQAAVRNDNETPVALHRLLDVLHLDHDLISKQEPEVYRDLVRLCVQCAHKKECRRGFERPNPPQTWPNYCPNAVTLRALVDSRKSA